MCLPVKKNLAHKVKKISTSFSEWLAIFCFYTLPLAGPAQAISQMLTTSSRVVTILLKSFGLYHRVKLYIVHNQIFVKKHSATLQMAKS